MTPDRQDTAIPQWLLNKAHGVAIGMPLGVALYLYIQSELVVGVIAVALALSTLSMQIRGDLRALE